MIHHFCDTSLENARKKDHIKRNAIGQGEVPEVLTGERCKKRAQVKGAGKSGKGTKQTVVGLWGVGLHENEDIIRGWGVFDAAVKRTAKRARQEKHGP